MKRFNVRHPAVREVTITLEEYRELIMKDAMVELMVPKIDELQARIEDLTSQLIAKEIHR